MLDSEKGIDRKLLRDKTTGKPVPKETLTFTNKDKMIYRQYECAAEEIASLSRFFQIGGATAHEQIFEQRYLLQQLNLSQFPMYSDFSHTAGVDLGKRVKNEVVLKNSAVDQNNTSMGKPETMLECIETFREMFVEDFEQRCGFFVMNKDEGAGELSLTETESLPPDIAVATLLNPLYGGE